MADEMSGIAFWSAYSRLQPGPNWQLLDRPGRCAGCGRVNVPVFQSQRTGVVMCSGDICLRQSYAQPGKSGEMVETRLSLGAFALITRSKAQYWTKHWLERLNPEIERHEAGGEITAVTRRMLVDPPDENWMYVAFQRSNTAEMLVVNIDKDAIRLSGGFEYAGRPLDRLVMRRRILALRDEFPDMTNKQWTEYLQARCALVDGLNAWRLFRHRRPRDGEPSIVDEYHQRHPTLAERRLPLLNSPEHAILALVTG